MHEKQAGQASAAASRKLLLLLRRQQEQQADSRSDARATGGKKGGKGRVGRGGAVPKWYAHIYNRSQVVAREDHDVAHAAVLRVVEQPRVLAHGVGGALEPLLVGRRLMRVCVCVLCVVCVLWCVCVCVCVMGGFYVCKCLVVVVLVCVCALRSRYGGGWCWLVESGVLRCAVLCCAAHCSGAVLPPPHPPPPTLSLQPRNTKLCSTHYTLSALSLPPSPLTCVAASTSTKPSPPNRTPLPMLYVRARWRLSDVELNCVRM